MRTYLTALMLLATLGLVSCGGGNDGASTGTPVVAQATLWSPTDNGGCGNSSSCYGAQWGPALNQTQYGACLLALQSAPNSSQCSAMGGRWSQWENMCIGDC